MRRIAVYFIIMLLAVSGCAVLTPSQRSEVEKFGKAAAAIVRGAGGLYIKHQQTIALRQAVKDGNKVMKEMVSSISARFAV